MGAPADADDAVKQRKSWHVGALRDVPSVLGGPCRLDVAYYVQCYEDGRKIGFGRFQYGADYSTPGDRPAALELLRQSVDKAMQRYGHDYAEWVFLQGGDL